MFKPTGFLWLFAHEIRLIWRGSILVRTRRHILVPVIAVGIIFQAAAIGVAWAATKHNFDMPTLILIANLNLIFLVCLMLSRAMTSAIDVLYSRGDVDFLLASPIPPSRVLAVRMAGVAASTAAPWLLLGGVLANALAVFGHLQALAAYPVIFALGVAATAAAFTIVVLLVGRLGPGRARSLAHTLALIIGVGIFALGQAPRYVSKHAMNSLWRSFMPTPANGHSVLWLPGRALLGQPAPLAACLALTALVFAAVLAALAGNFAAGAISAGAFAGGNPRARHTGNFRQNPLAAAMLKNLRLLSRFPGLVTQTVYRSLTLVPVAAILTGKITIGAGATVAVPLVIFLAGQLALFFSSVISGSEQAPDLAFGSPTSPALPRTATAAAAAYATLLLLTLPCFAILLREGATIPALAACLVGVTASNLAAGQKYPIPLMRAEFGKSQTGTILGLILGVAISSAWAAAAWLLVTPHPWALMLSAAR